jgi:hypothetical protein
MVNHPRRRQQHSYRVRAKMVGKEPIDWETTHAQTAYRWYDEMVRTRRPCDGGAGAVMGVGLYRNEQLVKETMIGQWPR